MNKEAHQNNPGSRRTTQLLVTVAALLMRSVFAQVEQLATEKYLMQANLANQESETAYHNWNKMSGEPLVKNQTQRIHRAFSHENSTMAPAWMRELKDQWVYIGGESLIYAFPTPLDDMGNKMIVSVEFGDGAASFSSFQPETNTFKVYSEKLAQRFTGDYTITVKSFVDSANYWQRVEYHRRFTLKVRMPEPKEIVELEEPEVKPKMKLPKISSRQILNSLEPSPFSEAQPVPYIERISMTGLVTIGWDKWMSVPPNYKQLIESTQIACKEAKFAEMHYEAQLYEIEENEEEQLLFLMKPITATLVSEQDQEVVRTQLSWNVVSYNRDFMEIQLQIPDPDSVSMSGDSYRLEVSFWESNSEQSIFYSEQGGTVRNGVTLDQRIYWQASQSVQEEVQAFEPIVVILMMTTIVFLFTWPLSKKTVVFWIYFNSLTLAVYLPMLDINMPSNVILFMMPFIDMFRFRIMNIFQSERAPYHFKREVPESHVVQDLDPTGNLQTFGYTSFIFSNESLLLTAFSIIVAVWILFAIKDSRKITAECRNKLPAVLRPNLEIPTCNFILRFSYQVFLEVAVCVFISLKASGLLLPQYPAQWLVSVAIFLAMASLIAFLCRLLFKGGPYIPGFYKNLTLSSLFCLQARQTDPEFDHKAWLVKYKQVLSNKFLADKVDVYKIKMKSKSGKKQLKPQHSIRIKRNQCQPVNRIENEEPMTERHLLETAESKGLGTVAVNVQDIEEDIKITDDKKRANNMIFTRPLDAHTAENSDDEGDYVASMSRRPGVYPRLAQPRYLDEQQLADMQENHISVKTHQHVVPHLQHQPISSRTAIDKLNGMTKDNAKKFYEGGQLEMIKKVQYGKKQFQITIPEEKKYVPPPVRQPGDPPEDKRVKRLWYKQKAIIGMNSEKTIPVPNRYKTLFLGLKLNHPKNATIVHPILFLVRRLIFAMTIVFMRSLSSSLWCLLVTMAHTLLMLAYTWNERQWKDPTLNTMHILNEILMYALCLISVYFCYAQSTIESRLAIGRVLIAVFLLQMLGNTLFLLKLILKHFKLFCKRRWAQIRRERTAGQVLETMQLINMQLFQDPLNNSIEESKKSPSSADSAPARLKSDNHSKEIDSKNLKLPSNRPKTDGLLSLSDIKYQIQPKRTAYGGLQGTFILSDKQMSFDHISSIMELEQSKQLTPLQVTDLSLLDLHREFQGYTFDCALKDHIRRFHKQMNSLSPNIFVDHNHDSMSVSQMSPDPKWFEAESIQSPTKQQFSQDGLEERDYVPVFLRDQQTYLQAQQSKQQGRRKSEHNRKTLKYNSKLVSVPEQTVEESHLIEPSSAKEALVRRRDGSDVWAIPFFKPTYSGPEAVIRLKEEQEKMSHLKHQIIATSQKKTAESTDKKEWKQQTPFESEVKMINFNQLTNQLELMANGSGVPLSALPQQYQHIFESMNKKTAQQFTADFLKEKSLDVSTQLRILEQQACLSSENGNVTQNKIKMPTTSSRKQKMPYPVENSFQSKVAPAPPGRRKEQSFSDMLDRSNEMSLTSRGNSMKSLKKLQRKGKQLSSQDSNKVLQSANTSKDYNQKVPPAMRRNREASFSGLYSESSHMLYLMQMAVANRSRDLHNDSIKSLKKLTDKSKQLRQETRSQDSKAFEPPPNIVRKREQSFSGIINESNSILSSQISAQDKVRAKAAPSIQRCDVDNSDDGAAQNLFVPPQKRKESLYSHGPLSSKSSNSAQSQINTPIRHQKSFVSSGASFNQSIPKKQTENQNRASLGFNENVGQKTPPQASGSKSQVIGEMPQEEEETVERGKEGKDRQASRESKLHSTSPERHEHETNQQITEEDQNQSKFFKDPNLTSFVNESSISNQHEAPYSQQNSFHDKKPAPYSRLTTGILGTQKKQKKIGQETVDVRNQSMITNMYNQHSTYARQLSIEKKNPRRDVVLDLWRQLQNGQGHKYPDHRGKDPFDIRQNENLSEHNRYLSIDRRNLNTDEDVLQVNLNQSSILKRLRHETPMVSKTIERQSRAASQELIKERVFMQSQPRNALFKTNNNMQHNTYNLNQKLKMDLRRQRSSKLRQVGCEVLESQTSKSKASHSETLSDATPNIFSERTQKHLFDQNLERSRSMETTSKASLSARTIVKKFTKNYERRQDSSAKNSEKKPKLEIGNFIQEQLKIQNQHQDLLQLMKNTQTAKSFKFFQDAPQQSDKAEGKRYESYNKGAEKPNGFFAADNQLWPKNAVKDSVLNILKHQQSKNVENTPMGKKSQASQSVDQSLQQMQSAQKQVHQSFNLGLSNPNTISTLKGLTTAMMTDSRQTEPRQLQQQLSEMSLPMQSLFGGPAQRQVQHAAQKLLELHPNTGQGLKKVGEGLQAQKPAAENSQEVHNMHPITSLLSKQRSQRLQLGSGLFDQPQSMSEQNGGALQKMHTQK